MFKRCLMAILLLSVCSMRLPADDPRVDIYGDPLPQGAVARLGTLRFRCPEQIETLAFSRDGKMVAVCTPNGVFVFEAATGKRIKWLDSEDSREALPNSLAFSPDGKRLAVLRTRRIVIRPVQIETRRVVRVWDLAGNQNPREYPAPQAIWVGWSPTGEPLALCIEKGALRLHELDARQSRAFKCPDLKGNELLHNVFFAFAPAGQVLAVADNRHAIHVVDTATGRERCTIPSSDDYLHTLALSPDGQHLASLTFKVDKNRRALDYSSVQLWNATNGKLVRTVIAEEKGLALVRFAPDGKTLATAGPLGVHFWDVATGRERSRNDGPGSGAEWMAFSPDSRTLATVRPNGAVAFHLWDAATGKQKPAPKGHTNWPSEMSFSADGRRVATDGGMEGAILVWDMARSEELTQIRRPNWWVHGIALSPDGGTLYSADAEDRLLISDAATGKRQHVIKLEDPDRRDTYQRAQFLNLSAVGRKLVVASYYRSIKNDGPRNEDTLVTIWDTQTRKQLSRRRLVGTGNDIVISSDASLIAVPHPDLEDRGLGAGPIRLVDVARDNSLTFPALRGQTWPLKFSPDARLLVSSNLNSATGRDGDTLRLWEVATAREVLSLPQFYQGRVAFSADGRLLAIAANWDEILVWDLAHGREFRRFKAFGAEIGCLGFAPDGRLISGLSDSTLLVWDVGSPPALVGKHSAEQMAKFWTDLAGADAAKAFRARWALAAAPDTTLPLLKERLSPVKLADAQMLKRLIADLNSDQFAIRKKAEQELEKVGELAGPSLRQALAQKPTLEMARRVEMLLGKLREPVTQPYKLQALRGVAVLENIGTREASKLLEALAQGAPEARLTQEAQAAMTRLGARVNKQSGER